MFWLEQPNGCWYWTGAPDADGYGRYGRGRQFAHRVVWEKLNGPTMYQLHHICEARICVNPAHLQTMDKATHNILHHAGKHINYPKGRKIRNKFVD